MTTLPSVQLSERIERPAHEVYAFVADPANLPAWASGLASGIDHVDGEWLIPSPDGPIRVAFAPPNEFGVADHDVTMPSGETTNNPLRVFRNGDGCEIVFSVRRAADASDEDFARDTGLVSGDLARLKHLMESGRA